jgi:hypothetical protein
MLLEGGKQPRSMAIKQAQLEAKQWRRSKADHAYYPIDTVEWKYVTGCQRSETGNTGVFFVKLAAGGRRSGGVVVCKSCHDMAQQVESLNLAQQSET